MNPIYEQAYRELTSSYLASNTLPSEWNSFYQLQDINLAAETRRIVVDAIDSVITETGVGNQLRSDAYHIMIVNLRENWVLPRLIPNNLVPGGFVNPQEQIDLVETIARSDALTLLQQAKQQVSPDGEITGHVIIQAINSSWERLQGAADW